MPNLDHKYVVLPVLGATLTFGALGWLFPVFLHQIQYYLLGILVLVIGLPHGATDFLLFQRLQGTRLSTPQLIRFFLAYLLVVGAYFCAWLLWPLPSLLLFLLVSTYHFGQSNWEKFVGPSWVKYLMYIAWGGFALGGAVLWHWDESSVIISQLVSDVPKWPSRTMLMVQWGILCFNILLIIGLRLFGYIDRFRMVFEAIKLAVLSFMFFYTPLLVGFTIYFTLWHSLGSLLSQVAFFRLKWPTFTLYEYYRQASHYTLLAVLGLLVMILGQPYLFPDISLFSIFLVFISCITLPHIFLIEESYK
jgi:Brp/Blh family beta-carotene 15,15'-monooxygenase